MYIPMGFIACICLLYGFSELIKLWEPGKGSARIIISTPIALISLFLYASGLDSVHKNNPIVSFFCGVFFFSLCVLIWGAVANVRHEDNKGNNLGASTKPAVKEEVIQETKPNSNSSCAWVCIAFVSVPFVLVAVACKSPALLVAPLLIMAIYGLKYGLAMDEKK